MKSEILSDRANFWKELKMNYPIENSYLNNKCPLSHNWWHSATLLTNLSTSRQSALEAKQRLCLWLRSSSFESEKVVPSVYLDGHVFPLIQKSKKNVKNVYFAAYFTSTGCISSIFKNILIQCKSLRIIRTDCDTQLD